MVGDEPMVTDERASLSTLLAAARERGFVGRGAQMRWFETALQDEIGASVLFVCGSGGIGKTVLLEAFHRRAAKAGRSVVYLDARDVACSATAVAQAIGSSSDVGQAQQPDVLLIDGYELLAPLERWFREECLPSRPSRSVTVIAGRNPPHGTWWMESGWRDLVRVDELTPLGPSESADLLTRLGVDAEHRAAMARLGRGHPLALALLAEAGTHSPGAPPLHLADQPDVIRRLCARIIDDVPDATHRLGLATCAHASRMTYDLLSHVLGSDADEVWDWLESRPYVRRSAVGLFLHDVVREVFEAEFAHRSPEAYSGLHRRVKHYFLTRLADPHEPHPDRAAAEILMLHRRSPLGAASDVLRQGGLPTVSRAVPGDHERVFSLIESGEGPASAAVARQWVRRQPKSIYLARADDGLLAFAMHLYVSESDFVGVDDPVMVAVARAVEDHGPLRPGERVNVNRYAGSAASTYQRHPMVLLVNGVAGVLEWAFEPAAWTFIITLDDETYGPYFEYLGMQHMFTMDYWGQRLDGYGWDRRRFPPTAFFELMARRELSGETGPPLDAMLRPAPLSRAGFAAAVTEALRQLGRPDRLAESPLLGTTLVSAAEAGDLVACLRRVLLTAISDLADEPQGTRHRRVLERTYLKGAPSQESAAEMLGLPFSTYRRHLSRAQERLIEVLWSVEIGVRPPPGPAGSGN